MNTAILVFIESAVLNSSDNHAIEMNSSSNYVIAAIIAFLIFCYLIFALVKPEKF